MKTKILLILLVSSNYFRINAQTTNPDVIVVKDWTGLIEAGTECEVSYSYVRCDLESKVLFRFYNEMPVTQNIKIRVQIKSGGYVFTEDKIIAVYPEWVI